MHRLPKRSAKDLLRHDAPSWMDLVPQLDARTSASASGCPMVVMVESTHDRKSDDLVAYNLRRRNRPEPFRNLLLDPLMRSCLVEVGHIGIEHALELLLLNNQQMIQAFLSDAPQEALTDRIGSGRMNRRFQDLDAAGCGHTSEARPKFGIVIPNQVLGRVPIRSRFSQRYARPRRRLAIWSRLRG
jgi:hypothetical protein